MCRKDLCSYRPISVSTHATAAASHVVVVAPSVPVVKVLITILPAKVWAVSVVHVHALVGPVVLPEREELVRWGHSSGETCAHNQTAIHTCRKASSWGVDPARSAAVPAVSESPRAPSWCAPAPDAARTRFASFHAQGNAVPGGQHRDGPSQPGEWPNTKQFFSPLRDSRKN